MSATIPTIYGFPVSPHVRTARIAFAEKHLDVDFRAIDLDHLRDPAYTRINPFQKMPALVHGDVVLYETPALFVYAEGLGSGPTLVPEVPLAQARMWQCIGIAQNHLYPVGAMQLYFHAVLAGLFGAPADPAIAARAALETSKHLDVLEARLGAHAHLAGEALSYADLYCGAMVDYAGRTRAGRALLRERPHVDAWLRALRSRPSFQATLAPLLRDKDEPDAP